MSKSTLNKFYLKLVIVFMSITTTAFANEYNCKGLIKVNNQGQFTSEPFRSDTLVSVKKNSISVNIDGYKYTSSFSEMIQQGVNAYKTGPNLIIHYINNDTFLFKNGTIAFAITHCN